MRAGVYDALIWGMVITILNEVPGLFSAAGGAEAALRLEGGRARRHKLLPCC